MRGDLQSRLTRFAGEAWNVSEDRISFRDDRVFIGDESIPFEQNRPGRLVQQAGAIAAGFYETPVAASGSREEAEGRPFF